MKRIITITLIFSFLMLRPVESRAAIDPKQQISIILFSGLGGAILGLSTLSFYDRPQDHLRNIALGGAIALIGSVIFTTVYAAKQSKAETETSTEDTGAVAPSKATKGQTKKSKSDKKDTTGEGGEDGTTEEDGANSEEGAMLQERNPKDDVSVKILLADYSNSKFSIDPFFLSFNTTTKRNGEQALSLYGRIIEINF